MSDPTAGGAKAARASNRADARARRWWAELAGASAGKKGGDPGALARLRRARTPVEAVLDPEARELVRRIGATHPSRALRVARLATLLAHVREDDPGRPVARALGGPDEESRTMQPARFRRLMLSESDEELFVGLRRALTMLDRKANVADLAKTWLDWSHPTWGDRVRIDWTFAYVGRVPKTDDADVTDASDTNEEDTEQGHDR